MQPGNVLGKLFEEHGCGNGAALTSPGIDDVGDIGTDVFLVFVVERQAPHFLASFGKRLAEPLVHGVVVGEDTSIDVAKRHHYSTSERGGVDQVRATELAGVEQAVGQHQAAFGIGIDDLDRLAGHGNLHVAWLLRLARRHVFRGQNDGRDLQLGLEQSDGAHGADHGGPAGHVVLHLLHAVAGLDGNAAGIESDALSDQAQHGFSGAPAGS